jgi:peptide/nickel transport system ATP-binding protein
MIFQEPMTSFSPVYTVGRQISEVLRYHRSMSDEEIRDHVVDTLGKVGIPKPAQRADAYPFELSGGMRQRAMIAMALACSPKLLIADEPTTALDVTIQAQILELIKNIQREMGMSIMIISHDMGVIANTADTVAVMYLGEVVEKAPVYELFDNPKHPYTRALLQSIPKVGGAVKGRLESIKGAVPDPYNMPRGCRFHPRCPRYMEGTCEVATPPLFEVGEEHTAACYLYGESR